MIKTIIKVEVIDENSVVYFKEKLSRTVIDMQLQQMEVEILNPHLVITPDNVGNFHYVATIIGKKPKEH
jgi:hypothetical protein